MTAAGVEFKIHSIMVIGGSKMLENGLFSGGGSAMLLWRCLC